MHTPPVSLSLLLQCSEQLSFQTCIWSHLCVKSLLTGPSVSVKSRLVESNKSSGLFCPTALLLTDLAMIRSLCCLMAKRVPSPSLLNKAEILTRKYVQIVFSLFHPFFCYISTAWSQLLSHVWIIRLICHVHI